MAAGLTSCLEDQGYTDIVEAVGDKPIVSFFGNEGGAALVKSYKLGQAKTDSFAVNLGGSSVLDRDAPITVGFSQAVLDAFNAKQRAAGGAIFEALPSTYYTITPAQPVIKAGQRDAKFAVTVTLPVTHDLKKSYLIPVGITNAGDMAISQNLGFFTVDVKAASVYEGVYRSTGVFTHPTAGARDINKDKTLATINANTVQTEFADLGGSGWTMQLTVNADNSVKLTPTGAASAGTVQEGVNKYDPATKAFTLNYKYDGSGGFRVVTETIKIK